jgi:tetratricopeptide (TPR) repeat protein
VDRLLTKSTPFERLDPRSSGLVAAILIILFAGIVYFRSLSVGFLFDDTAGITNNPSIRRLWRLGEVLSPPRDGRGVTGRPVVNLTLAINYAWGGTNPRGYHLVNLVLHVSAATALFGLVRRTLRRPVLSQRLNNAATSLSLGIAALWATHPLQTESVTCIIQRTEVLVGLFYLLTLYFFVRGLDASKRMGWFFLSLLSCTLGMASKEVMVSAPLLVLLYDRTFVSGTFRQAWVQRRGFYLALASTWLLLGYLVLSGSGARGAAAGFGLGVTAWSYALEQCEAILRYIELSFWPHPLILDYGSDVKYALTDVLPEAIAVVGAVLCTLAAIRWRPVLGFLGAWFFAILAPSSSIVPLVTQTVAEHRMYLPLAAVTALVAAGAYEILGFKGLTLLGLITAANATVAISRNTLYQSDLALWWNTVALRPENARARMELANSFLRNGNSSRAIDEYRDAIKIKPDYIEAHNNLGAALLKAGRYGDALAQFQKVIAMHPLPITHFGSALALVQLQRFDEAIKQYDAALRLKPDYVEALNNRGNLHSQLGNEAAALVDYETALGFSPQFVDAHINAAAALLALGRSAEALPHCTAAVTLQPTNALAHLKFGDALLELQRPSAAATEYREAMRLDANGVYGPYGLARSLEALNRTKEAATAYERTLQLTPESPIAHYQLAVMLERTGQAEQAMQHYQTAIHLQPNYPEAVSRLIHLEASGQISEPAGKNPP